MSIQALCTSTGRYAPCNQWQYPDEGVQAVNMVDSKDTDHPDRYRDDDHPSP